MIAMAANFTDNPFRPFNDEVISIQIHILLVIMLSECIWQGC